jgi:protocatechuate 3,4-dioxygenase beta subunit
LTYDGNTEESCDCEELPYLKVTKVASAPVAVGDGTYNISYTVTVTSVGGVGTTYDLSDTPKFDDDVIINSGSYSGQNNGQMNLINGVSTTLATNETIGAGPAMHTYTVSFNVELDLEDVIGDNEYDPCSEECDPSGENNGLLNAAKLTYDGNTEESCDCEELPYIVLEKDFVSATPNEDGTYDVSYNIIVTNLGGVEGRYTLTDTPSFDDDVIINSGSYSGGLVCCGAFINTFNGNPGTITMIEDSPLGSGLTDVFSITFNVTLDLEEGSTDGGDNEYTPCSESGNGPGNNPGEGLYNLAELDRDADGTVDTEDDACGDLPYVNMEKDFVSATPNVDGTYDVTYKITVTNTGGATGTYSLTDTPMFDDDVSINSGSYVGQSSGPLNTTGSTTLATGESIDAGGMQMYTLTFNVTLDLTEGSDGDNEYDPCTTPGDGPGSNPGEGLYNVADLDRGADGTNEVEDDACGDLPYIIMRKDLGEITSNANGTYNVNYIITVENIGGADGTYGLTDSPMFDDDVTINAWDYTFVDVGAGIGNGPSFIGAPPSPIDFGAKTLTTGNTHIYNLGFNVTLDLEEGSTDGGDNEYTSCTDPGNGPGSNPGEGLYNLAHLDRGADGTNEIEDDACGDLPNVDMEKDFVEATPNADGSYDVTYKITVTNTGGATGTYSLTDTPMFDDDVTINSGSYVGQSSGSLNTTGSTTLATGESIDAGDMQMYTLTFNVTLNLEEGSNDGGDNEYTECVGGSSNGSEGSPGEGLYNLAELDRNSDGTIDVEDDACSDLPYVNMEKDFVSATPNVDGTYDVTYKITVTNTGGATGTYSLTDTPMFDDDVTINSGSYVGQSSGSLNTTGSTTLATGESIDAGDMQMYTLTFNVSLDLTEGSDGDNEYNPCTTPGNGPGSNPNEGLYNVANLDRGSDGTNEVEDDACGDLPYIIMRKDLGEITSSPDGSYNVNYIITVENIGGADGDYGLTDTPMFDDDVTINAWDYTFVDVGAGIGNGPAFIGVPPSPIDFGVKTLTTGNTHIYTLGFNVTLDLEEGSNDGGDNEYTSCSDPGNGPGSNPGEGLYNVAHLDRGADGTNEIEDDACGDLPNVIMHKDAAGVTPNADGTYTVSYVITVENTGGATGTYSLIDSPMFDDDITIIAGGWITNQACCPSIAGDFVGNIESIVIASGASIAAGATDTYTIDFLVSLDLEEGSTDEGDNEYTACSESGNGPGSNPGEGLYNLAELDRNSDGTIDVEDDACDDLPNIVLDKEFVSAIQLEDGTYDVTYSIDVTNTGGVTGTYSLTDTPDFDDDITINGGSYSGGLICCGAFTNTFAGDPGTITLIDNSPLGAGLTDVFSVTFNVTLDLEEGSNDGGDNEYNPCDETEDGSEGSPGEGLYNLAELDRNSDGTNDTDDDACGDLPASLGDYVWEDVNGNGTQDEGPESALEGVDVELTGTTDDGDPVNETTQTDENGYYKFINLAPGDYKVTFPTTTSIGGEAAILTREDITGGTNDANDTNEDSDPNADSGMTETVNLDYAEYDPRLDAGYYVPGTISGYVLADTDNDDEGEDPIEGILIQLVDNFDGQVVGTTQTDENGFYEFTDLAPSDYTVFEISEPGADWIDVTDFDMSVNVNDLDGDDGFAPNDTIPVILLSGENDEDNDFIEEQLVSIGDYVWLDTNADGLQDEEDTGIEGVVVNLLDENGDEVDSDVTDEDGYYLFVGLEPGIYEIEFEAPTGFETSPQNVNGGNADDNGDDSDADPDTGLSGQVELTNGEAERDVDAGFYELASLGDLVFFDSNGNGIQDDDENGIEGITVNLLNGDESPTGESTTTNEDGEYGFAGLNPGDYIVEFVISDGLEFTLQDVTIPGADDTNDSDADQDSGLSQVVTLASGENNPTIDAGLFELLSLGNLVWIDTDNDGMKDDEENGVQYVDLALWLDLNNDDSPDVNTGKTAFTDENGFYLFEELVPGNYIVQVDPISLGAGGVLEGYKSSTGDPTDPDDDINNDDDGFDPGLGIGVISKTIELRSADEPINDGDLDVNSNLTVDFGFFDDAVIGNFVWNDLDADGIQDLDDLGINGVTVNLYDANNPGSPIATTVTAESPDNATLQGYYLFEGLVPGDYFVEFSTPDGNIVTLANMGLTDENDSDIDGTNGPGTTVTVSLSPGDENLTLDAGFYQSAKVGNYVWVDDMSNPDGQDIQDGTDSGINGVTVNLYKTSDLNTPFLSMETIDGPDGASGYYMFEGIPSDDYIIEVVKPNTYSFVVPNVGDDNVDSDIVDFFMGRTLDFTVNPADCIEDIDAGLRLPPLPVEWLYIRGEWLQDRDVNQISWATATEINSDYYIVERSYENEGFEDIGKVDSEGNSLSITEYSFDDEDIDRNGKYYYRLRQVDLDGTIDYSDIVVITVDRKGDFKADVYPNPAYGFVNINIQTSELTGVHAVILDVAGKLVMNNVINGDIPPGNSDIRVPLENLPAGTYIVRITSGEEVINHKILVLNR